jgi:hypothetical protein
MIRVYDLDTDTVMPLDVEVYLTGVVAAEMPVDDATSSILSFRLMRKSFNLSERVSLMYILILFL